MIEKTDIYAGLTQLGGATALPEGTDTAVLEKVENPQAGTHFALPYHQPAGLRPSGRRLGSVPIK